MLIPLYIVYPIYYRWVESGHRFAKTAGTVLFIVMVSGTLFVFSPDVYDRLMQVWNSYIVFVIGHYIGKSVKENRHNPFDKNYMKYRNDILGDREYIIKKHNIRR